MATVTRSGLAAAIEELGGTVRGQLIQPGDPGYDDARRVRNGLIDRRPGVIVRASGTADVVDAVNAAREHGLTLSVRGGAHNVAGNAVNDGGMVIDLSGMRAVHFDRDRRTARAQGGATWGDLDRETQPAGLSVPGGVVSTTGIGGLTLHGGLGHLRRKYGLTIDNLLSAEVVTADGAVRVASAEEHPDLFWALRGAGANVGVVTSFEFQARPIGPEVFLCGVAYPLDDAAMVLRGWRDALATMPDEVSSLALQWNIPDVDAFGEARGRPVTLVAAIHCGPPEEAERVTAPLRQLAPPVLDLSHVEAFGAVQAAFDPFFPVGGRYYWKSAYLRELSDAAIDVLAERGQARVSPKSAVTLWQLGGAISRVAPEATAYYQRDAPFLLAAEATWDDPADDERAIAWSRETLAAAAPFTGEGMYLNFPGFGEDRERTLRATYGPGYDRLVEIKTRYDPGNLFRTHLNIPPATA